MKKDPVQIVENHNKKIEEIFGKISKFFKNNSGNITTSTYQQTISNIESMQDSDEFCKLYGTSSGQIANTNVSGQWDQKHIKIGNNKEIEDFSNIKLEYVDKHGKGLNKFYSARFADFKCYDLRRDLYGIAWLFDPNTRYKALSVSGNLKANFTGNQPVDFNGFWYKGDFYGKFLSDPVNFKGRNMAPPTPTTPTTGFGPIIPPATP